MLRIILLLYVIRWGCKLATNVSHRIFSGVFNVDIMQRCLLKFNRLDFEGTLNDQRCNVNLIMDCNVNLIMDNISSRIFH